MCWWTTTSSHSRGVAATRSRSCSRLRSYEAVTRCAPRSRRSCDGQLVGGVEREVGDQRHAAGRKELQAAEVADQHAVGPVPQQVLERGPSRPASEFAAWRDRCWRRAHAPPHRLGDTRGCPESRRRRSSTPASRTASQLQRALRQRTCKRAVAFPLGHRSRVRCADRRSSRQNRRRIGDTVRVAAIASERIQPLDHLAPQLAQHAQRDHRRPSISARQTIAARRRVPPSRPSCSRAASSVSGCLHGFGQRLGRFDNRRRADSARHCNPQRLAHGGRDRTSTARRRCGSAPVNDLPQAAASARDRPSSRRGRRAQTCVEIDVVPAEGQLDDAARHAFVQRSAAAKHLVHAAPLLVLRRAGRDRTPRRRRASPAPPAATVHAAAARRACTSPRNTPRLVELRPARASCDRHPPASRARSRARTESSISSTSRGVNCTGLAGHGGVDRLPIMPRDVGHVLRRLQPPFDLEAGDAQLRSARESAS